MKDARVTDKKGKWIGRVVDVERIEASSTGCWHLFGHGRYLAGFFEDCLVDGQTIEQFRADNPEPELLAPSVPIHEEANETA